MWGLLLQLTWLVKEWWESWRIYNESTMTLEHLDTTHGEGPWLVWWNSRFVSVRIPKVVSVCC